MKINGVHLEGVGQQHFILSSMTAYYHPAMVKNDPNLPNINLLPYSCKSMNHTPVNLSDSNILSIQIGFIGVRAALVETELDSFSNRRLIEK